MRCFRLKKSKEFTRVLKAGRRAHAETLSIVYAPSQSTKMAVCVGKKHGKSVKRNRIKRLLRAAFAAQQGALKAPCSFLLMPRVREEYTFSAFKRDIGKILSKEHLLEP